MKTISADYNAISETDCLRLGLPASQADIRAAGIQPQDWTWLSDGEVIVGAQIKEDPDLGLVGVPDWKTLVNLDDEDAKDLPRLWAKLSQVLKRKPVHSAEEEVEAFRLLTILDHVAPPEIKKIIPPGYLALRRAGALHLLGKSGLAFHEVGAARQDQPDDEEIAYFYLELLLRHDPDRAAREGKLNVERENAPALVLAACIDIWAAAAEQIQDEAFEPAGRQILDWVKRFETAPGRERVRASILAGVQFHRGLMLLRLGQVGEAQATIRLAHATDPCEPIYEDASQLDTFDYRAREIAARFHKRPLPSLTAA